jgi:hypothetical protein
MVARRNPQTPQEMIMSTSKSAGRHWPAVSTSTAKSIVPRVAAAAYVTAIAAVIGYLIVNGPAMRAAAERQEAQQIDLEDRTYCQKLGMNYGTDLFATCATTLAEIRRLHGVRLNEQARGIF